MNFTFPALVLLVIPLPLLLWLPHLWTYMTAYVTSVLTPSPVSGYDYIVVGAGSAGSVLAGRLVEAGHCVLLIEAGGPAPFLAHIPGMAAFLQNSPVDWAYRTEPQVSSHFGFNKNVSSWPRGKVLGGSSILNYMLYMRGHSQDYDEWRDIYGLEGWGYQDILPYFKKSESMESAVNAKEKFHGTQGPLSVTKDNFKEPIIDSFMKAAEERGYKIGDVNGDLEDEGFTPAQMKIKNGFRTGTFKAFAEQYAGDLLTVITFANVNKVIFKGKEAVGVEVSRFGTSSQYFAGQEIILSAGTVGSPQILMLSGIGDSNHLEELGINTIHHSPQVGRNLQDHLIVPLAFDISEFLSLDILAGLYPSTWTSLFSKGQGPLTSTGCSGVGHLHSEVNQDKTRPDVQLHLTAVTAASDYGLVISPNFGFNDKSLNWFEDHYQNFSSAFLPTLSRPESRGFIKLRSSDPRDHPIIQPNYLTDKKDVDTLVAGIKKSLEMLNTDVMKNIGATAWGPDSRCSDVHEVNSSSYWECFVRHYAATVYHPVGTCAMGTVLDSRMRVKGIDRLRVVDGSSMPKIVGGNVNAPIIMMAEKAADMIISDYYESDVEYQHRKTVKQEL